MVKKLLTLALGLVLGFGAMAQWDAMNPTVSQDDIQFWTGTGSNRAVIAITWNDAVAGNIGLAWGVQWNGGTILLRDLMDTIAEYDSRMIVSWNSGHSIINNLSYVDEELGLDLVGEPDPVFGMVMFRYGWADAAGINKTGSSMGVTADYIANGDFVDWTLMDPDTYDPILADLMLMATDPNGSSETPVEATIDFADILYWVGEGTNEAVLAVNWADTCLAWGYKFNGTKTVADMMADIAAADPRFSYDGEGFINDILFDDGTVSLAGTTGNYWGSTNNGVMDMGMGQTLADGDFEKWGDPAAGVKIDSTYDEYFGWWYTYAYPMTVNPVSEPGVVEATIDFADILYWVGEGSNEAVLAVNWADTCLAWGYKFNGSKTVADMMADIAAADPRFSYTGTGYIDDILFVEGTVSLSITPGNYWGSTNNGVMDMGMGQTLANGDLEKWGDPAAGVAVDSTYSEGYGWWYTYAYPMTIHPVSVPGGSGPGPVDPDHGPFCGAVGTEGCNAIKADSSAIVAWATGVTVTRGPQNISVEGSPLASTGSESNAIGMATLTDVYSVVSLGDGGTAVVTFAKPIRNGEGPDFAVYENGFGDNSLELAFVEVSSDGEHYVRFAATCLTQTENQLGNAGATDPTNINNLAGKFRIGYGTPFDLEELRDSADINIDSIVYVRIVDVVGSINPQYGTYDAYGHIINDPWPTPFESSGFDLTGVAVLYQNTNVGINSANEVVANVYPNPASDRLNVVSTRGGVEAVLFDQSGRIVMSLTLAEGVNTLNISGLAAGVYMLRAEGAVNKVVVR